MDTPQRFIAVGVWNTAVGLAIVLAIDHAVGHLVHPQLVLLAAFSVSVIHAYCTQKIVVFRAEGRVLQELPRFILINGIALAINAMFLQLLIAAGIATSLSQAFAMLIATILSYFGHKHFSFSTGFRSRSRAKPPEL